MKVNQKRIMKHALLMLERGATVRSIAKITGFSKSTVHKDISYRLKDVNLDLYHKVMDKLRYNYSTKHLRGGETTRIRYSKKK